MLGILILKATDATSQRQIQKKMFEFGKNSVKKNLRAKLYLKVIKEGFFQKVSKSLENKLFIDS